MFVFLRIYCGHKCSQPRPARGVEAPGRGPVVQVPHEGGDDERHHDVRRVRRTHGRAVADDAGRQQRKEGGAVLCYAEHAVGLHGEVDRALGGRVQLVQGAAVLHVKRTKLFFQSTKIFNNLSFAIAYDLEETTKEYLENLDKLSITYKIEILKSSTESIMKGLSNLDKRCTYDDIKVFIMFYNDDYVKKTKIDHFFEFTKETKSAGFFYLVFEN